MRWRILRTLIRKEYQRHLANRGGLMLILLLILASLLLSFFGIRSDGSVALMPQVQRCYVDYEEETPLVRHLSRSVPEELQAVVRFRPMHRVPTDEKGTLVYPTNTAAIQLRKAIQDGTSGIVWFWYSGERSIIAPFEIWFWKETLAFVQSQRIEGGEAAPLPIIHRPLETAAFSLRGGMDSRSGIATALVLFGIFFLCVYLLPSMTCEEREKGVLLAQALSPATTWELLGARFLFYPALGIMLAALLAGTYSPRALLQPFFWLAVIVCVMGSMGIGLTIATLARTQRTASMGAMCYLMAVSLLLYICQQNQILGLPWLALEFHGPRMIHAALQRTVLWSHWFHLLVAGCLALAWVVTAGQLFRRRGWQ